MAFYTNSKDVKILINSLTSLEVEPFDKCVPESKETDLVLLDHDFCYADNEHTVFVFNVFVRRPDLGEFILERMKTSHHVFLFDRHWYQVRYDQDGRAFQFSRCAQPVLDARHTCIVHQMDNDFLLFEEKEALRALLNPFILGEKLTNSNMSVEINHITKNYVLKWHA